MTIERLFDKGVVASRSTIFIFDEGTLLYEGKAGRAPLDLISREIVDLNIRYKERRPVELIIRVAHHEYEEHTVRSLYEKIVHQDIYVTLVYEGVTVYGGCYSNIPKCYFDCVVKKYTWITGNVRELVIRI